MKSILRHRSFQVVLREWAAYLKTQTKPQDFSWWLENLMAEPRAIKGYPYLRELLGLFAREIRSRSWSAVRAGLPRRWAMPKSPFMSPDACAFFDGLKKRLLAETEDYLACHGRGGRQGSKRLKNRVSEVQNAPQDVIFHPRIQAWEAPFTHGFSWPKAGKRRSG